MIEYVVDGVYRGVGNRLWTIIQIDGPEVGLRWMVASTEGGGSVQFMAADVHKWLFEFVGMASDKVSRIDDARQRLRETLEARDRLNRVIARQAKAVEQ